MITDGSTDAYSTSSAAAGDGEAAAASEAGITHNGRTIAAGTSAAVSTNDGFFGDLPEDANVSESSSATSSSSASATENSATVSSTSAASSRKQYTYGGGPYYSFQDGEPINLDDYPSPPYYGRPSYNNNWRYPPRHYRPNHFYGRYHPYHPLTPNYYAY